MCSRPPKPGAQHAWRPAAEVRLHLVGRKAVEYYRRRPQIPVLSRVQDVFKGITFPAVQKKAQEVEERFVTGEADAVFIAYNQFRSAIAQNIVVEPLLPLAELTGEAVDDFRQDGVEYIYEPEPERLLEELLDRYLAFAMYHAMLESRRRSTLRG